VRDRGLLRRGGCGVDVCVECGSRVVSGWFVDGRERTRTAVLTRAKVVQHRMTAEAARTASTLGFRLVNTEMEGTILEARRSQLRRLCATAGDPGSSSCQRQAASERKERENREMLAQKPSSKEISLSGTTN
jgi:hypothetical protein